MHRRYLFPPLPIPGMAANPVQSLAGVTAYILNRTWLGRYCFALRLGTGKNPCGLFGRETKPTLEIRQLCAGGGAFVGIAGLYRLAPEIRPKPALGMGYEA